MIWCYSVYPHYFCVLQINTVRQHCIAEFPPYFGRVINIRVPHFLKTWRKFTDSPWGLWPLSVQGGDCCLLQSFCSGILVLLFPYLAVLFFLFFLVCGSLGDLFVCLGIFFLFCCLKYCSCSSNGQERGSPV